MKNLHYFFALSLLVSCSRSPANKFVDRTLQTIATLQDQRNTDSLLLFINHENQEYRLATALAFASVQDTSAVQALGEILLGDSINKIREAAAFALGQNPSSYSFQVLTTSLRKEKSDTVLKEILEALGKTLPEEKTETLVSFKPMNLLSEEGKIWGLYRLGLRKIMEERVVASAYQQLNSKHASTRLAACHFFARLTLNNFSDSLKLLQRAANDPNVFIRMAATQGLRNVKTDAVRMLLQQKTNDDDERVRVNAVRALRTFNFNDVSKTLYDLLNDSSQQVRIAVAESLSNFATKDAKPFLLKVADSTNDWRVQASLFDVVAALDPEPSTFESIKIAYHNAQNSYHKAALLSTLSHSIKNATFVGNELLVSNDPVILSSAALTLASCHDAVDFLEEEKPLLLRWYQQAIAKGDAAVTGIIAQVLGDSTKKYKPLIQDIAFLKEARAKLSLPKDNESIQPLEAAIAYFEGRVIPVVKNSFNHPIDWDLVKTISEKQVAIIKTTKGTIILKLLINEAPGSVANFVQLTNRKYFDGKFFHRVVPNFVVQTGCNRGDGYGSENYSIRSEFTTRRYREGSVGMASAGKDTEGTQWFITHLSTPHLDGRYTIFAEVIEGMDIVNSIHVGDRIIEVSLNEMLAEVK